MSRYLTATILILSACAVEPTEPVTVPVCAGGLVIAAVVIGGVELLRWKLRPEARRLRRIRKIGGHG